MKFYHLPLIYRIYYVHWDLDLVSGNIENRHFCQMEFYSEYNIVQ